MAQRKFTVTAALPYSNGHIHVGQIAGCYLPADIFVRYLRSRGDDVAFICGSDDYGVPVALTARKQNKTPQEVVEHHRRQHKQDFAGLGIDFDIYSGTAATDLHTRISQEIFRNIQENGHLTKKKTKQLDDPEAEMFLPDRYVEGSCPFCGSDQARGDQCESCGRTLDADTLENPSSVVTQATPEVRDTVHWFFQLSHFEDKLAEWINSHQEWRPMVRNFTLGLLKQGIPDRAITRDLDWGIPVPLEDDPDAEGKVLYVWFDAPIGYVSFTAQLCEERGGSWEDYKDWWKNPDCEIVHFIGEDNVVFHALMWPAMLMGEGSYELPSNVVANCFLNIQFPGKDEEKMSTSRGTAVWINQYLEEYDPDPLRYYLTMIAPENQRTAFQFDALKQRNDEELVATLGNFVHRTMTFTHKYFDGRIPERGELDPQDSEQLQRMKELPKAVAEDLEEYHFKSALQTIMAAAKETNRYFDYREPWVKRKEDIEECGTILNVSLNTIKTLGVVAEPFLPFAGEKIRKMLAEDEENMKWHKAAEPLPEGRELGEPEILFEKLL